MSKQKICIYAISVALLVFVALLCFAVVSGEQENPFYIELNLGDRKERIELWQDGNGTDYIFLPSGANLEKTNIRLETSPKVFLNGEQLQDGQSLGNLELDKPYELRYSAWGRQQEKTLVLMQSANIPTMFIDTQSGSMEYIHEEKGNKETGAMRLYGKDGNLEQAQNIKSINGRGNATWTESDKKPYSITLEQETDLLGMGAAQKWILLSNSQDPSNLRNKIVYDFAAAVGMEYTPETQWVDLYLNGEYAGLYLLSERNEIHPERVNINSESGVLVSMELKSRLDTQNYPYVLTAANQALRVHAPSALTEERKKELTAQWQSVENAILSETGIDPVSGKSWTELIDMDSWVKKYLIEEIFGNIDADAVSQYYYIDQGVVYAGPVWDYDIILGNIACWEIIEQHMLVANQSRSIRGTETVCFANLYKKPEFYKKLTLVYEQELLPVINQLLEHGLVEYFEVVECSANMNHLRWGQCGSREEVIYIEEYLNKRIEFLTDIWRNNGEYCLVKADYSYGCAYAVKKAHQLLDIYRFEDTEKQKFLGWYYKDTDEPFDPAVPITEDIELYAKWEKRTEAKIKSALKLVPLGVIAVLGVGLLALEVRRWKKSR